MLRVFDGGCLWCSYVNEFTTCSRDIHHHVSDDTLPHRAINRIKTTVQMSGTLVPLTLVAHLCVILRMGFIGEAWFFAWQVRGFYSVFVNTDWADTMRYYFRTSMNWGSTSTEAAKTSGMMTTIWRLRLCATLTKRPSIVSMAPPCIFTLCPLVMLISSGRI